MEGYEVNVTIAGFVLDRKNKAFPKENVLVGATKGAAEVGQIKWERAECSRHEEHQV